jgi:hypothetical protein
MEIVLKSCHRKKFEKLQKEIGVANLQKESSLSINLNRVHNKE